MSNESAPRETLFRRWVIRPVANQLRQGISPEKLAWSISLGVTLGIFPIMGSTTLVCLAAGHLLRLNQAVLHLFKSLVYPLHLALILVFIRLGQHLNGVPPIRFSIPQLLVRFKDDPAQFARDFGMAALHGVEAWAICALFLAPALHFAALPLLRRLPTGTKAA